MITRIENIAITDSRNKSLAMLQDAFTRAMHGTPTPNFAVIYHGTTAPGTILFDEEIDITTQAGWEKLWKEKLKTSMPGDLPRNITAHVRLWPHEADAKITARKGYTDMHVHWDLCYAPHFNLGQPGHFAVLLADPTRKITQTSSRQRTPRGIYDLRHDTGGIGSVI